MKELDKVCEGAKFTIWVTHAVAKALRKVPAKERARLLAWMQRFANDGFEYLDTEKLKHEGKFPVGDRSGTSVAIYAFKAWQVRVCGGVIGGDFIGTEIDASKKRDKADRDLLERSAKKLAPYIGGE